MKSYYNQEKIASSFYKFFSKFSLSKPHLKSLCYAIIGMIVAESVVTSDFFRKLKDDFSLIHLESIERRFRSFFCSNLFPPNQYHVIFLADRWFHHIKILSHIQSLRLLFLHPC